MIRAIVIGLGNMGLSHALALHAANGVEIVALVNRSPRTLPDELKNCQFLTDIDEAFALAPDLVVIATYSDSHAPIAIRAMEAGAHVFVEKPLALNSDELESVIEAQQKSKKTVTVGFNRRFSPHAIKIKSLIGSDQINVIATMNAGAIPADVWVHDLKIGGGRIIGEACHFIDLITYFTGSKVVTVCMNAMGVNPEDNTDNATILLKYENGSTGVINYFSNGSKAYSKERVEIYSQERTLVMDNFRETKGFGFKGFSKSNNHFFLQIPPA